MSTEDAQTTESVRLTDAEIDVLRTALRRWLPVSYEGGVKYLVAAAERILAGRVDPPAVRHNHSPSVPCLIGCHGNPVKRVKR